MRNEPHWLPLDVIIEVNKRLVSGTSEPFFVRDPGLLESAWARPQQHWHYGEDDLVVLAVSLLIGLGRNHPFGQGNKRTAYTAAIMFLGVNGYGLTVEDTEELGAFIESAIVGDVPESQIIKSFRSWIRPLPDDAV